MTDGPLPACFLLYNKFGTVFIQTKHRHLRRNLDSSTNLTSYIKNMEDKVCTGESDLGQELLVLQHWQKGRFSASVVVFYYKFKFNMDVDPSQAPET
jgi:hypothetical protein